MLGIEAAMHDIKNIRENPQSFDAALIRRGAEPISTALLALDEKRRALQTELQLVQARRNEASKSIGAAKGKGDHDSAAALMAEVAELKVKMPQLEEEDRVLSAQLSDMMAALPNLPHDDVPTGDDEEDNVELERWGSPREFDFEPLDHADLGPDLGLDFETGAAMSGSRFTFMHGTMARLNRAIGQFMLDQQTIKNGYIECAVPYLVRDEALFGTGQLPKFAEDSFRTTEGHWLIPTAEVSLTNSVREQILDETRFPIRLTALTPCFRSEAGSAGRDTKGLIRQHQFEKVEMVSITSPDQSEAEHVRMTEAAEGILKALHLPYRKMLLCTGDMGATARKTFDLEVWLPGQGLYREISSCSNCGDYQARRMNTRFKPDGQKHTVFAHTLNGSGLAVGRTLVAILENYQQKDGSVTIPDVLIPYMGGITAIEKMT